MISCVFIQSNKLTLEGHKSIYTFEIVCTINIKFRHSNFNIKEGTGHSISPYFFQYCYVAKKFINLLLVKMRGNISKEMVEKIKRRESLKSKLNDNQASLEFDHKDRKKEKMVVTFFNRGKIIFLEMEKFQKWTTNRDLEWA